ncbi:hypothetical protein G9A89_010424 [Geosiphon pyriformis]|nr:hypothetical protein G9A89_010424 [Geosiphon pyriformis]
MNLILGKYLNYDVENILIGQEELVLAKRILQVDGTDASILVCPSSTSDSPKTKMWNLVGAREANAEKFLDIDHKTGLFFVFKDLSVRAEGVFRLNFSLINLSEYNFSASLLHDSFQVPNVIRDNVMSNPFEVYSPHGFPGMLGPSDRLTYFRAQGLHIHFRKPGVRKANIKENPPSDDERNHVRFIST